MQLCGKRCCRPTGLVTNRLELPFSKENHYLPKEQWVFFFFFCFHCGHLDFFFLPSRTRYRHCCFDFPNIKKPFDSNSNDAICIVCFYWCLTHRRVLFVLLGTLFAWVANHTICSQISQIHIRLLSILVHNAY